MRNLAGQRQHVAEHRPVDELVGGDREVGEAEQPGEARALPEDRHRLLVADDRDRHDGHAGAHRDLDEAAAAEATAAGSGRARACRWPWCPRGTRARAAGRRGAGGTRCRGARPRRRCATTACRPRAASGTGSRRARRPGRSSSVSMPCMITGASGRDGAAVVGHEERAAVERDVFEALPFGPQPVAVDRVVERAGHCPHLLAAAPGVDGEHVVDGIGVGVGFAGNPSGFPAGRCVGADEAQRGLGRGHPPRKAPGRVRRKPVSVGRAAPATSHRDVRKRAAMPTNRASIHSESAPHSQRSPPSSTATSRAAGR